MKKIHKDNIIFLNKLVSSGKVEAIKKASFKISYFKSGGGNYLYMIKAGKKKYLARINYYFMKNEWRIKEYEYKVLKFIEKLKISPKVYYLDVSAKSLSQHFMIVNYIEGEPLKKILDNDVISMAKVLKKLHGSFEFKYCGDGLPPKDDGPYQCEIFEEFAGGEDKQIEKYKKLAGIKKVIKPFNDKRTELGDWFNSKKIFNRVEQFCLCHADLKKENIIRTKNGIKLIDWEMAGVDIPETDVGRLFSGCRLTLAQQKIFLKHYYGKKIPTSSREMIYAIKKVLDFFQIIEDYIILGRKKWDSEKIFKAILSFKIEG